MPEKKSVVTTDPEPFEYYTALRHGEVIGEGQTPVPDDIRAAATEIQWSNPSVDKKATIDVPAESNMKRHAPEDFSHVKKNMPRFIPEEHALKEQLTTTKKTK